MLLSMKKRKIIYSHWTGIKFWKIPCLEDFFVEELATVSRGKPQHALVFRREERYRNKNLILHCCTIDAVRDAYVQMGSYYVARLELLFMQLVHEVGVQKGILLANLMCSAPDGERPIITRAQLYAFVSRARGVQGYRASMRVLKYMQDSSRSSMEALLMMVLNLPHLLGGFKLGQASFNFEIPVPLEYRALTTRRKFVADIYYPSHKLIIEYNGKEHEDTVEEDYVRNHILETMGYKVLVVDRVNFYNLKNFQSVVESIRKILGKRLQIRTDKFIRMFRAFRRLLPRSSSVRKDYSKRNYTEENVFLRKYFSIMTFQRILSEEPPPSG